MTVRNLIVAQSGGPSCAINATLAGVIEAAAKAPEVERIIGSFHGIEGILYSDWIDLTGKADKDTLDKLSATPAMALGSCRFKLPSDYQDMIYASIRERFLERNIGYFLYIGGNDSMDTVRKLSEYFALVKEREPDAQIPVIFGLPKTIDNDLCGCDHTPGYGSAARYLSVTVRELIKDTEIYSVPSVTIVEVMGRSAGWLTLAAAMPRFLGEKKPQIVAIPETPFDEVAFLAQIRALHKTTRSVVAVVSEGIKTADGKYVGESEQSGTIDVFGHTYLSGVGKYLERLVKHEIGCKVRSIELNLMQRCSSHLASKTDIAESRAVGAYGVQMALGGHSGEMACIRRKDGEYEAYFSCENIARCANAERLVPKEWQDLEDPEVQRQIVSYLAPLIKGQAAVFADEYGRADYIDWLKDAKRCKKIILF